MLEIFNQTTTAQGMRKKGPFQDFFWLEELDLDGLDGRSAKRGDVGVLVAVGEAGGLTKGGSRGVGLYEVGGGSTVRMDALSSSEIPARVMRSEYELTIEFARVIDELERRIVSVSDDELIVDSVRRDAMLDARSEPEVDDPALPKSCLCAPQ